MLFWIFGFFAIPAVLLLGGYIMANHPTQRSNALCGYRTERSLKSEETWYFAQDYCGHLWLKVGGILLLPSFLSLALLRSQGEHALSLAMLVLIAVQMAALFLSIAKVESALKATFD